jgi:hypothetical protein
MCQDLAHQFPLPLISTPSSQADLASGKCVGEGEELYLIPVIDMANHATLAAGENAELRVAAAPARTVTEKSTSGHRSFALTASEFIVPRASMCLQPDGCLISILLVRAITNTSIAVSCRT